MFTGLIQALGTMYPLGEDRFELSALGDASQMILPTLAIGDSVAVDGVCLTVEEILPEGFVAAASPETLKRTTLGQRQQAAAYVNLETSLRVGSKLGGHFVTGHVDGIGYLKESLQTSNSWEMRFAAPAGVARYIIPKGSIAVNGVSLTVADCDQAGSWFTVAVIPHSYAETNLAYLQTGGLVNLEADILGKYVEKFLRNPAIAVEEETPATVGLHNITPSFLAEHGYL
ncbi:MULTISPECIES: riboflavin synthase [Cyanophyceae]|uniref:riboflavin synthase n=1 Tax=Cyanophyceae TaxID=3028117 RepID=UPI0016873DE1|nr:riboflavin synthase [Trichocoleus sp. FACHB-69]MBD1934882.1 riboflavin synthase [Trichocoleus sp. FACHB-69]